MATEVAYMSARETALKWGISQRRVAILCAENRIDNAMMVGNVWVIPATATKPLDAREVRAKCTDSSEQFAKPFLKWVGGKGQLLKEISKYYPFVDRKITKYAEPFVGGGAVLFDILNKFVLEEVYISDINAELINTYKTIRDDAENLIVKLQNLENDFLPKDQDERKKHFLEKREKFNFLKINGNETDNLEKAALMIYLNKTCFNGLYRVNRQGLYNVPMGAYKNPLICDAENLRRVSQKLQNVKIMNADYRESINFIDKKTFVYFDPPYRPLNTTSNFTAYANEIFNDKEQLELAEYVKILNERGAKIVASNSDPKNEDKSDNFFEDAYAGQKIQRVSANRMVNSKATSRGKISELLITNF